MNTPLDVLPMAKQYMLIIFAGTIGSVGYNINAGILQGFGDSKSSLLFLVIATVINIVLDLLFVVVFGWDVPGVAAATVIAQIFSWIFGIIYMKKKYDILKFQISKFYFDKGIFKNTQTGPANGNTNVLVLGRYHEHAVIGKRLWCRLYGRL